MTPVAAVALVLESGSLTAVSRSFRARLICRPRWRGGSEALIEGSSSTWSRWQGLWASRSPATQVIAAFVRKGSELKRDGVSPD